MKTMNSKMTTNSQLSTTEPKKQTNKQTKQTTQNRNRITETKITWWFINRERGGKGTENKQHKWQAENRQGEVKNSIGNGEAKELICTTHGRELKGGNVGGRRCAGQRGIKGENGTTVIA